MTAVAMTNPFPNEKFRMNTSAGFSEEPGNKESALKDPITSEFYPLNHATEMRELHLATRVCTRLERPLPMKQTLNFAFRLFSNFSVW